MSRCDGPGFRAGILAVRRGQAQQSADVLQREAKLPRPANEPQPPDVIPVIAAEPTAALSPRLR